MGSLGAGRFVAANTALTSGDAVFLYNTSQGLLSFDADGNGGGAAVPIATLSGGKALFAGDISVVAARPPAGPRMIYGPRISLPTHPSPAFRPGTPTALRRGVKPSLSRSRRLTGGSRPSARSFDGRIL